MWFAETLRTHNYESYDGETERERDRDREKEKLLLENGGRADVKFTML